MRGDAKGWKEMRSRAEKAEGELDKLRRKYEEMAGEVVGVRELRTQDGKVEVS